MTNFEVRARAKTLLFGQNFQKVPKNVFWPVFFLKNFGPYTILRELGKSIWSTYKLDSFAYKSRDNCLNWGYN